MNASTSSVKRWRDAYGSPGEEGLNSAPHYQPPARLTEKQQQRLIRDAAEAGSGQRLRQRTLDLSASAGSDPKAVRRDLPRRLRRHAAAQVGLERAEARAAARERDEAAIQRWQQEEWPRIKKGAEQKASVVFLDESGFMLQPLRRRTWAPRGQTPVQYAWDRHDRFSVLGL